MAWFDFLQPDFMEHITSSHNPLYKRLVRLSTGWNGSAADGKRQVLLEGIHLCEAWLHRFGPPEVALFDAERLPKNSELAGLLRRMNAAECRTCDPRLAEKLSRVGSGQGVFFLVAAPAPAIPDSIDHNCLWLDRVQDPGNVGVLLRTAAAAGIGHAYLSTGCCAAWSPKVLRAAQGAHFAMEIFENADLVMLRGRLEVPLIATAPDHNSMWVFRAKLPARCAWLLGNEGQGADPELLALADLRVFIPQESGVESLNVGVAAGICLFEQRRQHLPDDDSAIAAV